MSKLIIIRGNSGSGKTTVAQTLHQQLPGSLLIDQDVVRRDMLQAHDHPGNLSIDLMETIARFGLAHEQIVILEGILSKAVYGDMLARLAKDFDRSQAYYYDLTLAETVQRHQTRDKAGSFGPDTLAKWFIPHDVLGWPGEVMIPASWKIADTVRCILQKIKVGDK
ncbi:kinase [Schleiferilactobacillus perolens]|jgi:predicted kinase|uniref:kinase n=1 Tax=Schleiferilactobacillus perolens TaxID=100468 RepID=UPI002356537A|nr:kinase [Schleiferilactobacillus perolens]MCI2170861.1 kinase [Schleiferilactobacillus perolens]